MVKSIISIVAGYVIFVLLLIGTSLILIQSATSYLVTNPICSFISALIAGSLTANLAPKKKLYHVLILLALVVIPWEKLDRSIETGLPAWYPWVIMLVNAVGIYLGGVYSIKRTNRPTAKEPIQ
jgi:hypothetical protein